MVASAIVGTSCPIQSPDSPADAASSQALLTWIWQLGHRQTPQRKPQS
ncbi:MULTISPECIES: hypothetical protein [Duganella]|uniref:Uncharacterized protein n=1 Tax=Duganella zoogloeoides TaxID=75659 RepID=A0ABZ0Y3K6_9BURK|nr:MULTISPECIES: hypothetical protein [Duganella]WQH05996.1 hypothetical protein SR858_06575 [Duganella zoogloeoides]